MRSNFQFLLDIIPCVENKIHVPSKKDHIILEVTTKQKKNKHMMDILYDFGNRMNGNTNNLLIDLKVEHLYQDL